MNLQIEQSVRDWLASLEAFEGIAIHCGQSDDEIPNDEPLIMVACEDINTPAPTLYVASVRLIVSTPSVMADALTDRSERFLAAEMIREKLFRQLGDELPYQSTVEIERFEELPTLR
ncbi:MAG: GTPase, partial [Chloroflexota bacterium]